ncbi:TPA: DUF3310 domain-containing protein [Listeria monocytogenes]
MKLYHVETQEDFDSLMIYLENTGCTWESGKNPTSKVRHVWGIHGHETIICLNGSKISLGEIHNCMRDYPDTPIRKYKAKESLDELEDVSEELSEAVVKFLKIWNEKGPAWDYTDIINTINKHGDTINKINKHIDERQLYKYSPQFGVSSGFDKDGVVHSAYYTLNHSGTPNDNINNPSHYTSGGIETLDYIKAKVSDYPSYAVGNIVKYVSRYEHKNGIEDLKKAQFYLNDLIEEMEKGA